MSTRWVANENPVPSGKMNKLGIPHYTTADRTALTSANVEIGSILYDKDEDTYYKVTAVSPITFLKLGKTLGVIPMVSQYPHNINYRDFKDHFNRSSLNLDINLYVAITALGVIDIGSSDELLRHAHEAGGASLGNAAHRGSATQHFVVYPAKDDIDNSNTKATLEIRFRLLSRASGKQSYHGFLMEGGLPTTVVDQKCLVHENNGNFKLKTSDGSSEGTDLDSGTAGDTSLHKHRIVWQTTSVEYFIDGVSKGTKTTNLPTRPLAICMDMYNGTGGATDVRSFTDYWHLKME